MPKVMSSRQLLANQMNARNSTGPKTLEGKQTSSANAIKHGLLAQSVIIVGPTGTEVRAEFDALLADLVAEIQPRGLIEQTLVERIATCYWRLGRVQRFEAGAIRESLESPDDDHDDMLDYYEDELQSEEKFLAAMDRLTDLFVKPLDDLTQSEMQEIVDLVQQLPSPCPVSLLGMQAPVNPQDLREQLPSMRSQQLQKVDTLREKVKQARDDAALRDARKPLIASLPGDANLLKVIRYETMLDRQIHRALNELRRHRERGPLGEPE